MSEQFQQDFWNDEGGSRWVRSADRLDALMAPFTDALLEHAALAEGERVVDVGCGAGDSTRAAARRIGPGRSTGVDISAPLLALARRKSELAGLEIDFVEADAAGWTPSAPVDRVISRFGVMFFAQPAEAFANLRSWLASEGRLIALAWRSAEENHWMSKPVELLTTPDERPETGPGIPGPHSLGDADHTRSMLSAAGFTSIELEPFERTMRLEGSVDEVADFYLDWGPTARYLDAAPADEVDARAEAVRELVAARHDGDGLDLIGRIWIVRAR
ncbi:MAG: methyltransferase domain-containing protein [Acidobacteriota bacterium]